MKLIIDIPEDVYEEIMIHKRELRESGKSSYYLEGLIQNGTPLDKIKAEIEKAMEDFYYDEHDLGVRAGFRFALDIIDNHISGKEQNGTRDND